MMASSDLRKRKQDSVRQAICEEATQLILSRGFEQTTVEDIARAAGIGRRSFFRYFAAKEDVVVWQFDQFGDAVTDLILEQSPSLTPLRALERSLISAAEIYNRVPENTLGILRQADRTPSLRAQNLCQQERWRGQFADALRRHYKIRANSSQPELVATVGLGTMEVAVRRWLDRPSTLLTENIRGRFRELRVLIGE